MASNNQGGVTSSKEDPRRPSHRNSQRESVFGRARMSFVRSGGERGATIEQLRGTTGADFEGKADVGRVGQAGMGGCACIGGSGSDSNVTVLVKGPFCFVYVNETASSPKYAISLAHLKATTKTPKVVDLESTLGDVQYELTFVTAESAESFAKAVTSQAAAGEVEEVRKRLGHEHLLAKRTSVRYAESVALRKVKEAPDVPISTQDVLTGIAATSGM